MNKYLFSIGLISLISVQYSSAQYSPKLAALNQSVVAIQGSKTASCGTFRTMESMKYTDGGDARVVQVKVEQPICDKQQGVLALLNPSGADWKYKVIRKEGTIVSEGLVGYNRRIGSLETGSYLIQFTLPDGTSAVDEFTVIKPNAMMSSIEMSNKNQYLSGNELSFTAISESGAEYIWDFGDGTQPIYGEKQVNHKYSKPGIYSIVLTANNFDCTSIVTKQVIVTGPIAQGDSEK